jgi:hypothetical protein
MEAIRDSISEREVALEKGQPEENAGHLLIDDEGEIGGCAGSPEGDCR